MNAVTSSSSHADTAPLSIAAVLFDFDGTLADTAPDLHRALNRQLHIHGRPPVTLHAVRHLVSRGARGMVTAGFGITDAHPDYAKLRDEFLDLYEADLIVDTRLFDGMESVLQELDRRRLPWGIVTNKARRFAWPIFIQMGLTERAGVLVCGDTTAHAKPHPAPLQYACQVLAVPSGQCLYVGDDERDAQAARSAGMPFASALYGYLASDPATWDVDWAVSTPLDLIGLL
jgi:N-acetyl-D-muramate 6-phosphate phosphatase